MAKASSNARAAHRPSRRDDIISAAVGVFAKRGFDEASINDIAEAADVVSSAIYYHFEGGKEELFDVAIEGVYDSLDSAVERARLGHEPGSKEALASVIAAGNRWVDENPLASRMLYSQLPGATERGEDLRAQHEARHVLAAHRYMERAGEDSGGHSGGRPLDELAARTLVHLMISVMPLRLEDGPLAKRSSRHLVESAQAVGQSIAFG